MNQPQAIRLKRLDYRILETCIHCGMCLPTCPTYMATKNENASPRGRIAMMKAVASGELSPGGHFADEMYHCLGCLACQTACPADVPYGFMLEEARADVEASRVLATPARSFTRRMLLSHVFPSRVLLRGLGTMLWLARRTGLQSLALRTGLVRLFSRRLDALAPLAPPITRPFTAMGYRTPGNPNGPNVALLAGCVQDIAFADVNRDSVTVLEKLGCRVSIPRGQQCCGSLHAHNGELETARRLARINLDAIDPLAFDAIITNAAGCGSHLRHYARLLRDDPDYRERAEAWDKRVQDLLAFASTFPRLPESRAPRGARQRLTYQDACHLVHGQKIHAAPRTLLKALKEYEWIELPDSTRCCGSAGIYNVTRPEQARALGNRKIGDIRTTGADVIAVANPGCMVQLRALSREHNLPVRVVHPVTLLAESWQ